MNAKDTPGAEHTYMLAFDDDHHMYASYQHADAVFRFRCHNSSCVPATGTHLDDTFVNDLFAKGDALHTRPQPGQVPSPTSLSPLSLSCVPARRDLIITSLAQDTYHRNYTSLVDYYKGTFVQFGWPGIHDARTQGVRAVVWVPKDAAHKGHMKSNPNAANMDDDDDGKMGRRALATTTAAAADKKGGGPLMGKEPDGGAAEVLRPGRLWVANEDLHRIIVFDGAGRYIDKVLPLSSHPI